MFFVTSPLSPPACYSSGLHALVAVLASQKYAIFVLRSVFCSPFKWIPRSRRCEDSNSLPLSYDLLPFLSSSGLFALVSLCRRYLGATFVNFCFDLI